MRKQFEKFLYGTAFSIAMTPVASWANETGLNSAQNLAPTPQSATPSSATKIPKTTPIWTNLMKQPVAGGKKNSSVGRGFGDTWNKYAWSMKNTTGGMLVGTKNAFYDTQQYISPSGSVKDCLDNDIYRVTGIHEPLACMELFASPAAVEAGMATSVAADTRFAEIWRFDHTLKTWSKVRDDPNSQGFRVMETHKGKVYVGSDLGAFITGVDLHSGRPGAWNFPGSQLLASTDGKNFSEISSCVPGPDRPAPCTSANGLDNPYGLIGTNPNYTGAVNTSIRALASFNNKLYVGTFNSTGGQLWAYDDVDNSWAFIPLQGITVPGGNPYKPAIMELRVYKEKLYIGIGGPSGFSYLYSYDGVSGVATPVASQPALPDSNVGVIKLFVSSDGLLYIGNTDLTLGFSLQTFDGTTFNTITLNGFNDPNNAYAWSMAELGGRLYLGTFNQDFSANPFSASAQLWYKENGSTWQKATLPSSFGPLNYGIRNMEIGNNQLFLGTASNMLAPDLIPGLETYQAGTEVWTIR
jgi:hypothetical protein